MDKQFCKNCVYFHQHYALDKRKIFWVYCGHCMFGKDKTKLPDAVACDNLAPAPPDEEAFASKEYLSKELLQYLLNLELLPQIEDAPKQT